MNPFLTAEELSARWETAGRPETVVFTNGCFDLLHPGHVRYLTAARGLGDCLVVGINDDKSARRLKGPHRPYLALEVRAELLAALKPVDCVVPFGGDTPLGLIKRLRPDVLVKGGDYAREQIVGAREVESWGGRVVVLPLEEDYSSTAMALVIGESTSADRRRIKLANFEPYAPGRGKMAQELKRDREKRIKDQAGKK
jgi:rfaE bifunctional protein nucleotidyltransferase chain/domain